VRQGFRRPAQASCRCGRVLIEITAPPILSAICCCESCRTAGRAFERTPGAPAIVRPDGGTEYCLYRKDRVRIVAGGEHLQEQRLTPASPTRRVLADCCATPMFLDFTKGHWVSVYRDRAPGAPLPEMRIMARDAPAGTRFDDVTPTYPAFPGRFILRLLRAWAAMGLRRPVLRW
jgi:hypothetical protein